MATSTPDRVHSSTKERIVVPSYAPGNTLYTTTDSLTAQDIASYFRIVPSRMSSSRSSVVSDGERKSVQYLRPTSFEDQQKEKQELNRTRMNIIPYATFHEKYFLVLFQCLDSRRRLLLLVSRKQLLPMDQQGYTRDYQQRFDDEFLQVKLKQCEQNCVERRVRTNRKRVAVEATDHFSMNHSMDDRRDLSMLHLFSVGTEVSVAKSTKVQQSAVRRVID